MNISRVEDLVEIVDGEYTLGRIGECIEAHGGGLKYEKAYSLRQWTQLKKSSSRRLARVKIKKMIEAAA